MTRDTVSELLSTARTFCELAERETNRDAGRVERAAQYATIARAHALTAQAMLMQQRSDWEDAAMEREELRALWSAER